MDAGFEVMVPEGLPGLFEVFDRLDLGESVVIGGGGRSVAVGTMPKEGGPWLGITSSGSTGLPKLVWRCWGDLTGEVRVGDRVKGWHWASPYLPWTFAGVQVALQAWRTGGRASGLAGKDWLEAWEMASREAWDAISTTPTYMDLWVQNEPQSGKQVRLKQVTLGGEVLRPECGERLRARFPDAEFRVVYASAEWGVLLKTSRLDGWYETGSLDRRRPGWRVENGMLMLPTVGGGWGATGDLVEQDGGLMRVVGRADRVANVAGSKVNLDEVSRLAEEVPGVLRATAVAEASPVTGQVVVLRYDAALGNDGEEVEQRLAEILRQKLPKVAWPRKWLRGRIEPEVNGKRRLG